MKSRGAKKKKKKERKRKVVIYRKREKHGYVKLIIQSDWPLPEMAVVESSDSGGSNKVWGIFKLPFRSTNNTSSTTMHTHTTSSSSSYQIEGSNTHNNNNTNHSSSSSVSSVARSLLPTRRRLRLDPGNKLYFPCTNIFLLFFIVICFTSDLIVFTSIRSTLFFCLWLETSEIDPH